MKPCAKANRFSYDASVATFPSVYAYLDYRAFLREHFAASKAALPHYSFRYLARKAGFTSSNFLKLVMDGERNLGAGAVEKVARGLKLSAEEAEFFGDLVVLNQAATVAERNRAYERVASNRRFRAARRLEGPLFEYLTHWFYPAVRELAARADFRDDPAWVSSVIVPKITTRQARGALATLEKLGLLVRDASGRLARGDPSLTTGHEVRDVVVPRYHLQMIERAAKAVESFPPEERDVSALTVCVRATTLADLKQKIRRFREDVLERCDSEDAPERVYQLCIQLFPLSTTAPSTAKASVGS